MNDTMRRVHQWIDNTGKDTWVYEERVLLPIELALLILAAIPVVTGPRSAIANAIIISLRLFEAYWRREDGAVFGRHKEGGGVAPLPERKRARAEYRAKMLTIVTWIWPGLATMVQAAETKRLTAALCVGLVVTLVRAVIGAKLFPAWRASRIEWKSIRAEERTS